MSVGGHRTSPTARTVSAGLSSLGSGCGSPPQEDPPPKLLYLKWSLESTPTPWAAAPHESGPWGASGRCQAVSKALRGERDFLPCRDGVWAPELAPAAWPARPVSPSLRDLEPWGRGSRGRARPGAQQHDGLANPKSGHRKATPTPGYLPSTLWGPSSSPCTAAQQCWRHRPGHRSSSHSLSRTESRVSLARAGDGARSAGRFLGSTGTCWKQGLHTNGCEPASGRVWGLHLLLWTEEGVTSARLGRRATEEHRLDVETFRAADAKLGGSHVGTAMGCLERREGPGHSPGRRGADRETRRLRNTQSLYCPPGHGVSQGFRQPLAHTLSKVSALAAGATDRQPAGSLPWGWAPGLLRP